MTRSIGLSVRIFLAVFALCLVSHAQTSSNTTAAAQAAFDAAYWAHQAPIVAALAKLPVDYPNTAAGGRTATANQLATEGYTIDGEIDVWGWDPYLVMLQHERDGYTWYPSLLQPPIAVAPGVSQSGVASYDPNNPPQGSIKVSLSLSDYPPFNPPTVSTAAAPPTSCVGIALGAGFYAAPYATVAPCNLANGAAYTSDPRGAFIFHINATPFGSSVWFTSQSGN